MDYVLAARLLLGTYLAGTGALKLPDLKGFSKIVQKYGGMTKKHPWIAYLIPALEVAIGIALLAGILLPISAAAALIMCATYTYGVSKALLEKKRMKNCGCFGTAIKVPLTKWSLVEDITCTILSIIILAGTW